MGTINLTLNEWQELIQLRDKAEARSVALQQELDNVKTTDSDGTVRLLLAALTAAREVVRFAVANYPPEAVRGWPHEQLVNFANLLEAAPGASQDYKEMAIELRTFAREAKVLEDKRTLKRLEITSESDYGIKDSSGDSDFEVATL